MTETSMNHRNRFLWAFIFIALAYGLYQAATLAWCCDDAFISFRCAKNLIDGNGLVFNPGEYVEVYTNFLFQPLSTFHIA